MVTAEKRLHFLGKLFLRLVGLCYTVHGMSLHWMFFLVVKLYQMDVAHAILLCRKTDFSSLTAYHLSAKFELRILRLKRLKMNMMFPSFVSLRRTKPKEKQRCVLQTSSLLNVGYRCIRSVSVKILKENKNPEG